MIVAKDLKKHFKVHKRPPGFGAAVKSLFHRTYETVKAVDGVSFTIERGERVGFLGPNGAGKTTTIKMLTGLIAPTGGTATIFGARVPSPESMKRVGFLPENPYIYPYLTPTEFVELCARLSGLSGRAARDRTRAVLDQVGVLYAADRPVRRLSKGMLQRTGRSAAYRTPTWSSTVRVRSRAARPESPDNRAQSSTNSVGVR